MRPREQRGLLRHHALESLPRVFTPRYRSIGILRIGCLTAREALLSSAALHRKRTMTAQPSIVLAAAPGKMLMQKHVAVHVSKHMHKHMHLAHKSMPASDHR